MLIDSSALVAIILDEEESYTLAQALERVEAIYVTPIVIYESAMAVARSHVMSIEQATEIVQKFCKALNAQTTVINDDLALGALTAACRFGKGRHKAALNMGDCFSYAAAKALKVPLLFKGNDFTHTDIVSGVI